MSGISGSGKTTWLLGLCGARARAQGQLILEDREYSYSNSVHRREVFENLTSLHAHSSRLLPQLSVEENILLPQDLMGRRGGRIASLAEIVRIFDLGAVLKRPAGKISQGEAQRASVARAVYGVRSLLILDEPFVHLQEELKFRIVNFLCRRFKGLGVYVFLSSHDPQIMHAFPWKTILKFHHGFQEFEDARKFD